MSGQHTKAFLNRLFINKSNSDSNVTHNGRRFKFAKLQCVMNEFELVHQTI